MSSTSSTVKPKDIIVTSPNGLYLMAGKGLTNKKFATHFTTKKAMRKAIKESGFKGLRYEHV
jgi:hypothetical protein